VEGLFRRYRDFGTSRNEFVVSLVVYMAVGQKSCSILNL